MRRYFLLLLTLMTVGLVTQPASADDNNSSLPTSYFNQDAEDTSTNDFSFNDSDQTPNNQKLAIPQNTPTPLEGIRWRKRTILIYMRTTDPQLKAAFRGAVKKWNQVKVIKLKWTKNEDKANIIATDSDLSAHTLSLIHISEPTRPY